MRDQIGEQKERLEAIETGVSSQFQKLSKAHQEECKDLVDEYNQLLDQYNKKLGNFSDRAYKDKVQINVWNRTVEIKGPESKIQYTSQADLDKLTQTAQDKFYEANKSNSETQPAETKVKVEPTQAPKEQIQEKKQSTPPAKLEPKKVEIPKPVESKEVKLPQKVVVPEVKIDAAVVP